MVKLVKGSIEAKELKKTQKIKKGKGFISDTLNLVKNKGKDLIKEEGKKLLEKGVDVGLDMLEKKITGKGYNKKRKGILNKLGKTLLKTGLEIAPLPNIAKTVLSNVGDVVIDGLAGGNLISNKKTKISGKALKIMGSGYNLKMM